MKNLVKQTLERDFDLLQYAQFVKNLFNEIEIQPQEIKVPDSSKEFIKKITFLSDFSDTQKRTIDVYAVELAGGTKVECARSFQRNLISKLLKDNTKDAGLVAFYSKDNPDWRLSFIKLDYKLTDKGVKVEVGTPPKRYSFLVGKTEPSHTAQTQLLPILKDHINNPLLSDLEEAFSVEKVTKEFYERYRKLFEDLSKDLKKNKAFQILAEKEGIDIDNFAKKLLGQIVFLYFLQRKGWLGVPQDKAWGQGDKLFLRTLFDKAKAGKQDFYDHYLEPLFYDTLNNPRRDEVDPAYSRYFDCKIPFLNGGLFEPDYDWKNTIVYLGNEIFEEIIDTFDLYNFTVKEDEPLEKEVAVDPEMLGKVFENLLPENMRKGQGAYYTPREIVHYMCQESLINHLSTETKIDAERIRKLIAFKDEDLVDGNGSRKKALGFSDEEAQSLDRALANIKMCDPACGSGAFLVGMLNEIVSARRILEPRSEYKLKKEAIQECIYGVDIDPGAVDIAKLRLWLSLVVDFELRDIEPLPNLDYKIMCGNSLLEELIVGDESLKLFDERLLNLKELKISPPQDARQEELKKQLQEKQKELFNLHAKNKLSMSKKNELDLQILAITKELNPKAKKTKSEVYHPVFFADQADEYFKRLRELHKQFFTEYDPIKKKERRKQIEEIELEFIKSSIKEKVDEFNSKIKNLNMQDPGDRKKQAVLMRKKLEYSAIPEQIRNSKTRPYFLWKLNFFEVFQEKGGFDVVIANPPYITIGGKEDMKIASELKKYFAEHFLSYEYKTNEFILFLEWSLYLLRQKGIMTYIIPRTLLDNYRMAKIRKYILDRAKIILLMELHYRVFDTAETGGNLILISENNNEEKERSDNKIRALTVNSFSNKNCFNLINQSNYLKVEPYRFYIAQNDVYDLIRKLEENSDSLEEVCSINNGVNTGNAAKVLLANERKTNKYRKILEGKDVHRYCIRWKGLWINYDMELKDKIDLRKLETRQSRIDFSLRTEDLFNDEKLIVRQTADELIVAYDDHKYISRHSTHLIRSKEQNLALKYILGIMNSRLLNFYYRILIPEVGKVFAEVKVVNLSKLPIRICPSLDQKEIVGIVDKIHFITKDADYLQNVYKQERVKEYERQIDQMVYKLYGLTSEEIKIVESFNAR